MKPCDPTRNTPDRALCSCMHLVAVHEHKPATKTQPVRRSACTHVDESGRCPCPSPR